uniref:REST corepressor 2 n=1 Tax=Catharus ustulatus TaxID=91951 RepID=A0A8C3UE07_CATUS
MPAVMEKPSGILSRSRAKAGGAAGPPHSEDETSEDEHAHDSMIRVGADYQAVIPDCKPESPARYSNKELKGMLVWAPNHCVSDAKLDRYIAMAKDKHGYNIEQALGMLLWHKHDVEKSLADLANFTPFPDEWTVEDKVLFEQAFSFHGKSFSRIQQMLPDKLIPSLVKYYYSWKKPEPYRHHPPARQRRRPPRGMRLSREGRGRGHGQPRPGHARPAPARLPAGGPETPGEHPATPQGPPNPRDPPKPGVTPPSPQVQRIKQINSGLRQALDGGLEGCGHLRWSPPRCSSKFSSRWTTDEQLLVVQALRRYGRDFPAVAAVLGNKTAAQVRSFVLGPRRRLGLERLLQERQGQGEPPGAPAEEEEAGGGGEEGPAGGAAPSWGHPHPPLRPPRGPGGAPEHPRVPPIRLRDTQDVPTRPWATKDVPKGHLGCPWRFLGHPRPPSGGPGLLRGALGHHCWSPGPPRTCPCPHTGLVPLPEDPPGPWA